MAGLEVVASIAGVATAAIKISVSMNDIADELGSAGRDVRYISNEMACFSQVLRLVHSSLEDSTKVVGSSVVKAALNTLPQLVEQCGMVHEEANGLMVSLKPPTGKDSSLPFIKRVRFIFQKSRITVLRSLLDSSKSTLNLLLVTLNIEMAKMKSPNKELMDQLQSERKAFIRVVASQSRALDEALKEVEKAKKETSKLKLKADKEKQKQDEIERKASLKKGKNAPDDSTLAPPPMYSLPAPSVTQFVYTPPQIDSTPQDAVVSLALSLEAPRPRSSSSYQSIPPDPPPAYSSPPIVDDLPTFPLNVPTGASSNVPPPGRPDPAKRVFSDPGPPRQPQASNVNLKPDSPMRERSRSPYSSSRTPANDSPNVPRKMPSQNFNTEAPPLPPRPPFSSAEGGEVPSPDERSRRTPYSFSPTNSSNDANPRPTQDMGDKPQTYKAYKPPPQTNGTNGQPSQPSQQPNTPYNGYNYIPKRKKPPPPAPIHGTTYISLQPYSSREIGHLEVQIFDPLVDVVSHTPEEENLPYPTAFDTEQKHYWQASLHHRRGPRGLLPHDVVCGIDDERLDARLKENWFSAGAHLIADQRGRVWVGPGWEA